MPPRRRLPALESLRVLEACVRHRSFTRAASELCVTTAAVSLRIRELEAELETPLFVRTGPRVAPTAAGAALARRVSQGFELLQSAVDEARDARPPLRVTAPPTFAARWLQPRLSRYSSDPEALPLRLDVSMELRGRDAFDLAIRTGLGEWPGFRAVPLLPIDATPMLSPRLAATIPLSAPQDMQCLSLLPHDDWPRWFREAGVAAPALRFHHCEYSTCDLDASAALDGTAVALLSPTLFGALVREGQLLQPFSHVMRGPQQHYLLTRLDEARPEVLRFSQWLEQEARDRCHCDDTAM